MKFKMNNDLMNVKFSSHNLVHFFGSMILAMIFNFQFAYSLGIIWEFSDSWKPWYTEFKPTGNKIRDYIVSNLFYADGYSLQDLLVHDLCGAAFGHIVGRIIRLTLGV